ncbi:hypothetical protein ASG87_15885 [Frateuria sp. Soil773]|uniref:hypothetical protein n=1 Tax=Frateuria sp. Soil773 TaxID=1736407 RepID=UPI0006F5E9B9|nr:hypothetical protein [Frateuria sp. Soil773]KRE96801.1 hypothetical protein ASG87_15885 [Frateuria sp. Soil773]
MKAILAFLLAAGVVQGAPALAQPASASPLVGSWAVDVSRLPMPPAARPKKVTITFKDAGSGKWGTRVEIVDAGGTVSRTEGVAALDGTAAPVSGSPEADTVAVKLPVPGVLVMNLVKGGQQASTRVYAAAADGKTMIETASYVGKDGLPVMRTHYFARVR